MEIPDDLDMGEMGMDGKVLKKGITCKLHNDTDPRYPQECVGGCGKTERKNGATECLNIGLHGGMFKYERREEVPEEGLPVKRMGS